MARKTVPVKLVRHVDGKVLGAISVSVGHMRRYRAGTHPDYQWPEGVARAGDVISDAVLDRLDVHPDTVIYLDE